MTRIRLGPILAAAAVVVATPRHLVAALHAAGLPAPSGPDWQAVVIVSAGAWALLEALTLAHLQVSYSRTRERRLIVWTVIDLVAIAAVNAPSLVADSAGLGLIALVGVASALHVLWAVMQTATYLFVVVSAFAADAANARADSDRERADRLTRVVTEDINGLSASATELRDAVTAVSARIDAIDSRTAAPIPAIAAPVAYAGQIPAPNAQPALQGRARRGDAGRPALVGRESRESRVLGALREGYTDSLKIAAALGIPGSTVRTTDAWHNRDSIERAGVTTNHTEASA